MASNTKAKTIRRKVVEEAERREVPRKKLDEFMEKKVALDIELNDKLDELLAEFRKETSVFLAGHLKLEPKKLEEGLSEGSMKMKTILAKTTMLFAMIGDSAYKVIIHDTLVKGLDIVKTISVKMNDLNDSMNEVQKQ